MSHPEFRYRWRMRFSCMMLGALTRKMCGIFAFANGIKIGMTLVPYGSLHLCQQFCKAIIGVFDARFHATLEHAIAVSD